MTAAAVAAARTPLPRPRAISAPVEIDASNKILVVKRPRDCSGYEAYLWRQAYETLTNAAARGSYNSDADVRCSAPGHPDLVRATPGANLELHFRFAGTSYEAVYTELVSKPLSAFVTIDRGTLYFLGVSFKNRT